MPFDSSFPPLCLRTNPVARVSRPRRALVAATLALCALGNVALAAEPADVCTPLRHIVAASDYTQLPSDPHARLPGLAGAQACRAGAHAYDCRWRAHWDADGYVNDPLEELGADIAACFGSAVHDLNTPLQQHFIVSEGTRRVAITASVVGASELHLRIVR